MCASAAFGRTVAALLDPEDRESTGIARRIAALLLLGPVVNAIYGAVRQATYVWPVPVMPAGAAEGPVAAGEAADAEPGASGTAE